VAVVGTVVQAAMDLGVALDLPILVEGTHEISIQKNEYNLYSQHTGYHVIWFFLYNVFQY
jgi:hypothetical protein